MVSPGPTLQHCGRGCVPVCFASKTTESHHFTFPSCFHPTALESLGFASYITEVKDVLQECKTVALKRRKASSRLENLGIPEEELLRQQQELFAKVWRHICTSPCVDAGDEHPGFTVRPVLELRAGHHRTVLSSMISPVPTITLLKQHRRCVLICVVRL